MQGYMVFNNIPIDNHEISKDFLQNPWRFIIFKRLLC